MKRPIVPLLVLLLVLVLGAGPRLARPPAATAQTGTVTFYSGIFFNQPPDCTNLCGGIVQPFTSSQATLAGWGIAGHIASLKLAGVPAIAVYTGENFSGTCETIIEDQAALRGHTVGENQIASFKLNATCDGPLAPGLNPVPFVSDVIVKAQPQGTRFSTCPSSYTWRATDLNLGIDNVPEVTLCLHFTGDPAKDPYIPALRRGVTATDGVTCNNTVGFDEGVPGGQAIVLCRANPALTPSALTLDLRTAVVARRIDVIRTCTYDPLANFLNFGILVLDQPTDPYHCTSTRVPGQMPSPAEACRDEFGAAWLPIGAGDLADLNGNGLGDALYLCALIVNVRTTPPVATPAVSGTAGVEGWYRSPVRVTWTVDDAPNGSARVGCDPKTFDHDTRGEEVTCKATNFAGSASQKVQVKIDTTPPELLGFATSAYSNGTGPYPAGHWTNAPVTVNFLCRDQSGSVWSGIATNTVAGAVVSDEVQGGSITSTGQCVDKAGNSTPPATFGPINIDTTRPVVTATAATADGKPYKAGDWTNQNLTIAFVCVDTGAVQSGVGDDGVSGSVVFSLETSGQNVPSGGTCYDKAFNLAANTSFGPIKLDKTRPVTTATPSTPANAAGWHRAAVTVSLAATDDRSGVAATEYSLDDGGWTAYSAAVAVSAEGTHTLKYRSRDQAGNAEDARTITLKLDKTPPTCTARATPDQLWPPDHKLVAVTANVTPADSGGSGLATPAFKLQSATSNEPDSGLGADDVPNDIQGWATGTAATGGQLRAERGEGSAGRVYTLTYEVADVAGNTATCRATVTVPRNR